MVKYGRGRRDPPAAPPGACRLLTAVGRRRQTRTEPGGRRAAAPERPRASGLPAAAAVGPRRFWAPYPAPREGIGVSHRPALRNRPGRARRHTALPGAGRGGAGAPPRGPQGDRALGVWRGSARAVCDEGSGKRNGN